jgi:hypothetical protein
VPPVEPASQVDLASGAEERQPQRGSVLSHDAGLAGRGRLALASSTERK